MDGKKKETITMSLAEVAQAICQHGNKRVKMVRAIVAVALNLISGKGHRNFGTYYHDGFKCVDMSHSLGGSLSGIVLQ